MTYRKNRGYRGKYPRIYANQQAIEHVEAYRALERKLGPIVNDVRKEFFSFHSFQLVNLLDEYELKYGNKAAEYARETMPKWKSGQTKMSGQTAERLLNLVPRYLTYDSRFHMVQKLCNHHAPKIDRTVSINPENINAGLAEVEDHLNNLLSELPTIKWLPDYVSETVKWLNDDDVIITRGMLAEIDRKRADLATITAKSCLQDIRQLVAIKVELLNNSTILLNCRMEPQRFF